MPKTATTLNRPKLDTSHPAIKRLHKTVKEDSDIQAMRDADEDCEKYFGILAGDSMAAGGSDDDNT